MEEHQEKVVAKAWSRMERKMWCHYTFIKAYFLKDKQRSKKVVMLTDKKEITNRLEIQGLKWLICILT